MNQPVARRRDAGREAEAILDPPGRLRGKARGQASRAGTGACWRQDTQGGGWAISPGAGPRK